MEVSFPHTVHVAESPFSDTLKTRIFLPYRLSWYVAAGPEQLHFFVVHPDIIIPSIHSWEIGAEYRNWTDVIWLEARGFAIKLNPRFDTYSRRLNMVPLQRIELRLTDYESATLTIMLEELNIIKNWYPRGESNSQNLEFKPNMYAIPSPGCYFLVY